MKLGVAAAPKCTHPLIPSVRNQKLLPTCISACRRVGDPSVDPVCVLMHRADNGRWPRSVDGKKSVGIPKKQKFRWRFRQISSEFYFSPLPPSSLRTFSPPFIYSSGLPPYRLYFFFLFIAPPLLKISEPPSPTSPIALTFLFFFFIIRAVL